MYSSLSSPFSAHDTGLVTLQVAVSNQIISNSVVFEYKARALPSLPSSQHDWLSLDGRSLYRVYTIYFTLLCREVLGEAFLFALFQSAACSFIVMQLHCLIFLVAQ